MIDNQIVDLVSEKLELNPKNVMTALRLIEEGSTIPFVARYRREETGGLIDEQLVKIVDQYKSISNFISRRNTILNEIKSQEKLTPELEAQIMAATTLAQLEDLYRPYKPKKATRGSKAKDAGLEPLAKLILSGEEYEDKLEKFINVEKKFDTEAKVLQGALDILAENVADEPSYRTYIKELMFKVGKITSSPDKLEKDPKKKYLDYYEANYALNNLKNHTFLALNRAQKEEIIKIKFEFPEEQIESHIAYKVIGKNNPNEAILKDMIKDSLNRLIYPSISNFLFNELFEKAQDSSLITFEQSLRDILMKSPYKAHRILGFDPGYHHGCKLAVIDETGKVLATNVIYPTITPESAKKSLPIFINMLKKHNVEIIALGNGTASRESEDFINVALDEVQNCVYEVVSEDGASIYSVTKVAQDEFPDFDANLRSAVSIARRLLDPLSELVKIEPSGLGVGQYQHDLEENKLKEHLGNVVISVVNNVGVDVNTASSSLLNYVSGLNKTLANNIVSHIHSKGPLKSREDLLKVKGFGPKAYENAAGFLRVNGKEPLDKTAVHPESYDLAKNILKSLEIDYPREIDRLALVDEKAKINLSKSLGASYEKIDDIISSLSQPNRDPRGVAEKIERDAKVRSIDDLTEGMILNGTVRNITDFGAFVDLGVHISGLLHISEISNTYITKENLRDFLSVGKVLKVKVKTLDKERERIALTLKF